jgi:hypothetical protein
MPFKVCALMEVDVSVFSVRLSLTDRSTIEPIGKQFGKHAGDVQLGSKRRGGQGRPDPARLDTAVDCS